MIALRRLLWIGFLVLPGTHMAQADNAVPPLLTTTAATTVDGGGRPWAYLGFGENQPGLLAGRRLAIYLKAGTPDSTNQFYPQGPVAPSSDQGVIQVQLGRAAKIGDNLAALEAQIIALHRWLLNSHNGIVVSSNAPPAMPLNQRISAIIARAAGDRPLTQLLDMYGLTHPALRLVRGSAWASPLPVPVGNPVTIEVREEDAAGQDISVIGRTSFLAGQGEILAAPGPLVVVPDLSASGDLTIRLRWATPDALRHASTRHQGDVVWRVSRTFAEAQGFDQAPPVAGALDALSLSKPNDVKRAGGPVFPTKLFGAADVADFSADPTTSYLNDNNGRFSTTGTPFAEGSQYYYFVAAADALGRTGPPSAGALATVCRRVPPPVPSRVSVIHQWSPASGQSLEVNWQANPVGNAVGTTRYEVFRGDDLVQLAAAQRGELDLDAVPIVTAHPQAIQRLGSVDDPGVDPALSLHFFDNGAGVTNKTWWYAVRAIHTSPPGCGDLASALSPPVFAGLQDRTAPPAVGFDEITEPELGCIRVACMNDLPPADEIVPSGLDSSALHFIARCDRRPGIVAAHFQVIDTVDQSVVVPETSVAFAVGESTAEFEWTLRLAAQSHALDVQCAAEAGTGNLSLWAHSSVAGLQPDGGHRAAAHFLAGAIENSELNAAKAGDALWTALAAQPAEPCPPNVHLTVSPLSGRILHPKFCVALAPRTEQYRIYRRVEDGPLTLIAQGLQKYSGPGCAMTIEDVAPPVFNGQVYYFVQLLDEQGRSSAMRRLASLKFTGDQPPAPVLLSPQAADFGGTLAAPVMNLTWVCPPEHVERFELFVTSAKAASDPDQGLSSPPGSVSRLTPRLGGVPRVFKAGRQLDAFLPASQILHVEQSLLTGRVGGDFGAGPRFTMQLKLDPALKYTVWLRALGPHGEPSEISRTVDFQWQAPAPPPADIAWPVRPLPPVAAFNAGIQLVDFSSFSLEQLGWAGSVLIDENATPVGIRVGSLATDSGQLLWGFTGGGADPGPFPSLAAGAASKMFGKLDPNQQVFTQTSDSSQSLLPCVLYRQQVANSAFPQVSGDVVQCSPFLFGVAWADLSRTKDAQAAALLDPFFRWVAPQGPGSPQVDLYLLDTQPVIGGAAYRYWLVRFSNFGEPIQTVPCGTITIRSQ